METRRDRRTQLGRCQMAPDVAYWHWWFETGIDASEAARVPWLKSHPLRRLP
jgi:hypothetical protein